MTKLTVEDLEAAIVEIQKHIENTGSSSQPTKLFYQPAAIAAMGLTHEDVLKILEGDTCKLKQTSKSWN